MAFLAIKKIPLSRTRVVFFLSFLVCFATIFSSVVEGTYSNTVLYPVTEETRAARATGGKSSNASAGQQTLALERLPGAPSRYLEYEGPDATYTIRLGTHPTISYPNLEKFPDTEIRIRYDLGKSNENSSSSSSNENVNNNNNNNNNNNQKKKTKTSDNKQKKNYAARKGVFHADDCPRHFLWLSDKAVTEELEHRIKTGKWSERVMVEKTYFTLFYGGTGLASQYMDSVDDFQTDLVGWDVMNRSSNHCHWEGVECKHAANIDKDKLLEGFVVGFSINGFSLEGTLPHDLHNLKYLRKLDLKGNRIQGTIPASWGKLKGLTDLDLGDNRLSGSLHSSLTGWENIETLVLSSNQLEGEISPELLEAWSKRDQNTTAIDEHDDKLYEGGELETLDLSGNKFRGIFPMDVLVRHASNLESLDLSNNLFTGTLPTLIPKNETASDDPSCDLGTNEEDPDDDSEQNCGIEWYDSPLGALEDLDLSNNSFHGQLPYEWVELPSLEVLNLSQNQFTGSLPAEIFEAFSLVRLELSHNQFTGTIPDWTEGEMDVPELEALLLDHNQISGSIPYEVLEGLGSSLEEMNLGSNKLVGSLPSSISKMTALVSLDVHGNRLTGKLPHAMNQMSPDIRLNLTDNLLIGSVPKLFCGGGAASSNLLFRQFGCEAILCPAGTFHPNGAASLYSGCRPCPIKKGDDPLTAKILGRSRCGKDNNRTTFVHGDLNGDGELSEREVLRLLYTYTNGQNWGTQFETWADTTVDKCDLNGVVCVDGRVAKLDLTDAALCTYSNADRKVAPAYDCRGIPAEISKLTQLEILTMNRRKFLRGTLPTEIGELTNLKYLDISSCPMLTGPLPSEIGHLTDLKYLNIGGCRLNGTIPEELFELDKLEKLHLSMNLFTGTVPSSVEKMTNLKELLLSRTYVNGTIPEEIGGLGALENFEMYGNQLVGAIPESLGRCTNLKRIDLFNNKLTGTIPESLTDIRALQILHIKLNHLSGTISSGFGKLPNLSWFDVSTNHLHGTIPESFVHSKNLKDFRLGGGNMIHNPVPKGLCSNTNINGGLTKTYGCSGVICPLGTYSDPGHATHSDGCKPCPNGRTTTYLGSSRCVELTDEDILTMFYDVMTAANTFPTQEKHWSFDRDGPICSWNGVECDENEMIESIWFPLLELNAEMYD